MSSFPEDRVLMTSGPLRKVQEPKRKARKLSPTEGEKDFKERLVQLLDGQMPTFETNLQPAIKKEPNIMIGNETPKCIREKRPLQSVFIRLLLKHQLQAKRRNTQIISSRDSSKNEYLKIQNFECRIG